MAKANLGTMEIKIRFTFSLWDSIKLRIAGKEFRERIINSLDENIKPDNITDVVDGGKQ